MNPLNCSCGHSQKSAGVGYWTAEGWCCKKCGEIHTPHAETSPGNDPAAMLSALREILRRSQTHDPRTGFFAPVCPYELAKICRAGITPHIFTS